MNTLYYGDNLKILREGGNATVMERANRGSRGTLHYCRVSAPFNSNRNYNVLFRNESGSDSESQITASRIRGTM